MPRKLAGEPRKVRVPGTNRWEYPAEEPMSEEVQEPASEPARDDGVIALLQEMRKEIAALHEQVTVRETEAAELRAELTKVAKAGGRRSRKVVAREPETWQPGQRPIPYYNPIAIGERFSAKPGRQVKPGERLTFHVFRNGVFQANTDEDEEVVRSALLAYGPRKPDEWRGDDLPSLRVCKNCGFRTGNLQAMNDHEASYTDHRFVRLSS